MPGSGSPEAADKVACAFDTALLAGCANCRLAEKTPHGEQILVLCRQTECAELCRLLFGDLRHKAGFALARTRDLATLTHGQGMRLRCGGLRGLAGVLEDEQAITDVADLVERLMQLAGGRDRIDWSRVIREISAWRPPGRRGRG